MQSLIFNPRTLVATLALAVCSLIVTTPQSHAGDKRAGMRISFHVEGEETDGPNRVRPYEVHGEQKFFNNIPVLTHKNFVAYYPFANEDGTFGAAFLLDEKGKTALAREVQQKKGRVIIPVVNAQAGDPMLIDRTPDRFVVLWSGLSTDHYAYFEKEWKLRPITGPEDLPKGGGR